MNFISPKVSIIIPVYNGSNFLREAIDSALAQTYENKEILVINDGSKDNGKTEAIALSYGNKIRYFYKENGGVASALNLAIKEMKGDYFSWLSHDDLYYEDKIKKQIETLLNLGKGKFVIYSDYAIFINDSSYLRTVKMGGVSPEHFRYWLIVENCLNGCTLLIPKTAFEEYGVFNETLMTTQDYDLWFRIANSYRFVHLAEVLVKSRQHAKQGSLQMSELAAQECDELMVKFIKNLTIYDIAAVTKDNFATTYTNILQSMELRGLKSASILAKSLVSKTASPIYEEKYKPLISKKVSIKSFLGKILKAILPNSIFFALKDLLCKLGFMKMQIDHTDPILKDKFTDIDNLPQSDLIFRPDPSVNTKVVKQLSFSQKLLRFNLLKIVAKYLLDFKILNIIIGFFYSHLNYKAVKNNIKNFKSNLILCDKVQNHNIYALYPTKFPGVANSTITLFDRAIPLPSFGLLDYTTPSDKIITEMALAILESPVKILIISGGTKVMFALVNKIHAIKGSRQLFIYFLWHGSSAQWCDEHHLEHFYEAYKLYSEKKIEAIITLKKDLEKVLEKHNIKTYLLQNFIQNQTINLGEKLVQDKFKIGIWSAYANWVKNLHPQILAVSMLQEQCSLYTNFKFCEYDSWTTENLEIKNFTGQLPHNELINAMSNTDVTLYVTNTECSPMIAIESLSLGIPSLVGPTSGLYDDDEFLRENLTVNRVDCAYTISVALEKLFKNYEQIKEKIPQFIEKYNKNANLLKTQLYEAMTLHREEQVFSNVYANDLWTNGSGPGSHKDNTIEYRKLLQEYFNDSRFVTYIDLGCGDWQIMSLIDIPKNKVYKGYDIVKSVIEDNKAKYETSNVHFMQNTDFNTIEGGDLLIIKDVMIHWPNAKVLDFINNVLPRFKYALVTNDYSEDPMSLNIDIDYGQFRYIDLTKLPFSLQNTNEVLEYSAHGTIKKVYLYKNPNFKVS